MDKILTRNDSTTILSASESWSLLATVALGRLVTVVNGQADIFPVNFVVQRKSVLFRIAEGTKLISAAINSRVVFEADEHDSAEGWSVIVKGLARYLRTREEVDEAEQAQLLSWTSTRKQHYVRLLPTTTTGRRFRFGTKPDLELGVERRRPSANPEPRSLRPAAYSE